MSWRGRVSSVFGALLLAVPLMSPIAANAKGEPTSQTATILVKGANSSEVTFSTDAPLDQVGIRWLVEQVRLVLSGGAVGDPRTPLHTRYQVMVYPANFNGGFDWGPFNPDRMEIFYYPSQSASPAYLLLRTQLHSQPLRETWLAAAPDFNRMMQMHIGGIDPAPESSPAAGQNVWFVGTSYTLFALAFSIAAAAWALAMTRRFRHRKDRRQAKVVTP
jgi:hypothetical protein